MDPFRYKPKTKWDKFHDFLLMFAVFCFFAAWILEVAVNGSP